METIQTLGARIIDLRKQHGISREELAKEFDIPYTTLRNYENGLREPGHVFLIKVAKRFNVTTDYLLGISDITKKAPAQNAGDALKDQLLHNYDQLNEQGREKLVDYSDDLTGNEKYTQTEAVPSAKEA